MSRRALEVKFIIITTSEKKKFTHSLSSLPHTHTTTTRTQHNDLAKVNSAKPSYWFGQGGKRTKVKRRETYRDRKKERERQTYRETERERQKERIIWLPAAQSPCL